MHDYEEQRRDKLAAECGIAMVDIVVYHHHPSILRPWLARTMATTFALTFAMLAWLAWSDPNGGVGVGFVLVLVIMVYGTLLRTARSRELLLTQNELVHRFGRGRPTRMRLSELEFVELTAIQRRGVTVRRLLLKDQRTLLRLEPDSALMRKIETVAPERMLLRHKPPTHP